MNAMIKLLISTLVLTMLQFNLFGQSINDAKPMDVKKHSLGFGAGFSTGYGISYKYIPTRYGLQLNFSPYMVEDNQTYSTGLTLIYKLVQGEKINLLLYQGNHYFYRKIEKRYNSNPSITELWTNGLGFGVEFFSDFFSFSIMTGFARYSKHGGINLTVETGVYYKF